MPPKYSHVKKRSAAGLLKPGASTTSNLIKESYDPNNPNGSNQHQYHHHIQLNSNHFPILGVQPNSILPNINKDLSQAMSAVAHLERAIARILLLRFKWDMARLYSTRLHSVSLIHIPVLVAKLVELGGPSWPAMNADSEEVKDFFRGVIGMDMREAGERVATKSVLWSYTALRRFALAHNVPVCATRGLHSLRLLPHYAALKDHLDTLEEKPAPTFEKPSFFGGLDEGFRVLEEACMAMGIDLGIDMSRNYDPTIPGVDINDPPFLGGNPSPDFGSSSAVAVGSSSGTLPLSAAVETRIKIRLGYIRMVQTLWRVAREFDVQGYGQVLRDKLTIKWCECGCSTDHLGEVCERTVREEEEDREREGIGIWGGGELTMAAYAPMIEDPPAETANGKGKKKKKANVIGKEERERIYARLKVIKEKEWDGRGSGIYGWENEREEDIWEVELDFGAGKNGRGRGKRRTDTRTEVVEAQPLVQPKSGKYKKTKVKTAGGGAVILEENIYSLHEYHKRERQAEKAIEPPQPTEHDQYAEEEAQMTIGEMMEWRYVKAEREKELGNVAFRKGHYHEAVRHYQSAYEIEPEMPHYQLNLAAAYLQLNNWIEAEEACNKALAQHRSAKGLIRRAKARKMQGKIEDAIQDLRALIRLQPFNTKAMVDLLYLLYPPDDGRPPDSIKPEDNPWNVNMHPETDAETSALYEKLGITRPKRQKPLPFHRTKADDVKLKIIAIPPNPVGSHHADHDDENGEANGHSKGILKSGKVRGKEKKEAAGSSGIIRGTAADYGVHYFAWDRYLVKKVD